MPFEPWSGVNPTPGNERSGYCHHQDILFPTWHRAYVALYEVKQPFLSWLTYVHILHSKKTGTLLMQN